MATATEPREAQLPLAGGREGATVTLRPLLCGRVSAPPGLLHREESRLAALRAVGVGVSADKWVELPVQAFLVEHPSAGRILVDTGFHTAAAVDSRQGVGRLGGLVLRGINMDPEQSVPGHLRALGLEPDDIDTVLLSHLHPAQASGISQFPKATFLLSSAEWEAAAGGRQTEGYLRRQFDHAFDYRMLDFESPEAGSYATFGRSHDIFGDGSVRMVFTPGHTPGHCSIVLRLSDREVLIASDAVYTMRTLEETALPFKMADEHRFRRSLKEIQLYRSGRPDALVIPGHDMQVWRRLQTVYE
jgi:glyoxylase-like metal-dependent hydrolase (beta-lactamase superfamily II)